MTSRFQKFCLRFAFVLLIGIFGSSFSWAQAPAALHFERGEELVYEAEFSRALLRNVDIADFRFNATRVPVAETKPDGPEYYLQLFGEIKSKGFFSRLFNLNFLERVTSTIEPRSFALHKTEQFDQQGKRVRSSQTVYDREAGKVTWTEHDLRDPSRSPRVVSAFFTGQVQDVLSAIYFLRTQPLVPGKTVPLTISNSGKIYQVPIRVIEKKRMKTVLGKVETIRVLAGVFGPGGLVGSEGEFSIWLTADERHIPVKARVKHEYGTFEIKLKKIVHPSKAPFLRPSSEHSLQN